jgi:triacylglycerol lipase
MHSSSNVAHTSPRLSHLSPDNMPTPPPNLQKSPHKAPHPVLRWFGSVPSPSDSQPPSPSSDPVENLLDALTSPLPALSAPTLKRPPRAVPPNMPLWSSPSYLLGLSRVTLPTASLSNLIPATRPFDPSDDSQSPGAPIYLQHSPPERSSLDALRSLRNRRSASSAHLSRSTSLASLPSLPSLFLTTATPSWWRFQNDNKEDIDRLLSEEDRAPTVEEERSRIHKKCAWYSVTLGVFLPCPRRSVTQTSDRVLSRSARL